MFKTNIFSNTSINSFLSDQIIRLKAMIERLKIDIKNLKLIVKTFVSKKVAVGLLVSIEDQCV